MSSETAIDREPDPSFSVPPLADTEISVRAVDRSLPFGALDPDAVKVVRRLSRFGHEAYLVGGCVRDILLGIAPKDFDVATSARPSEIRRLFRNSRLIGRRFRLAHILFKNRKVIEAATFRRTPTEDDDVSERHAAENLFGNAGDDAVRRDFTINALMYDVRRKQIRDWVGGLNDIERGVIRTIGDPDRRLPEDPVRIVRAVKFSARLGFEIEPSLREACARHAPLVLDCSKARLVEEVLKLLRSGKAAPSLEMIGEIGALAHLLPALDALRRDGEDEDRSWAELRRADELLGEGRALTDAVLLAALLCPACDECLEAGGDVARELEETLREAVRPLTFTRRQLSRVRQIYLAQRRLARGPRTRRARKLLDREYAPEAIDLMEITAENEETAVLAEEWRRALRSRNGSAPQVSSRGANRGGASKRSGRRRRRPSHKRKEQA